jgi:PAS domain-containing protein
MASPWDALAGRVRTAARHPVVRRVLPTVLAFAAAALATAWVAWLQVGPGDAVAVTPAAGVAFAVALLLPMRRAVVPLVAVALAIVGVALLHDVAAGTACALAIGATLGAALAATLLHWYADGRFQVGGVRDLSALVITALAGGGLAAAVLTGALAIENSGPVWWRVFYRTTAADAIAMVLVACVAVASTSTIRRRGSRIEAAALALAIGAAALLVVARWDDPLAFVSVLLLLWAAARFGIRPAAAGALVLVGAADWALARGTGAFTTPPHSVDGGVLVIQAVLGVTLLAVLGFAAALTERDGAEHQRWVAAERSRRIFDHSPVGIAVTTLTGEVVEANRALCLLLGRPEAELVGRPLHTWSADDSGHHMKGPRERKRSARGGKRSVRLIEYCLRVPRKQ